MTEYSRFNVIYRLQKWLDSVPGQTFLNYAYSWGASIVILGTLFKLTHLTGANVMLFIGMGTEVLVFFISAFDRPFDKTADGRDIPVHVTENYLEEENETEEGNEAVTSAAPIQSVAVPNISRQQVPPMSSDKGVKVVPKENITPIENTETPAPVMPVSSILEGETIPSVEQSFVAQPSYVPQMNAEEAAALNEAQGNYIEELKKLVETLSKVNEQSERLTRDSEEMENLNRTLTGISKVYEMQLKGASQQIGTIDQINDQSRKMAQQIEQLNKIYARMIEAMTVNMRVAAPGTTPTNVEG